MSLLELDRYYTPPQIARRVVEVAEGATVTRCLDSACGDGSLLIAARALTEQTKCIGMDVDRASIYRLRNRHPDWTLSRADALLPTSWSRVRAALDSVGCDLAVLNPPFSMGAKKGVTTLVGDFTSRCSVAMAHVLSVLMRARPGLCCAIVPESLLFSELDQAARDAIERLYQLRIERTLRNSTFRGTRANAAIVTFTRRETPLAERDLRPRRSSRSLQSVMIVRGGLPLFEAKRSAGGLPYVHSTALLHLALGDHSNLRYVRPISRGLVRGHVVLLPRVGVPHQTNTRPIFFETQVQLSDCVVALSFRTRAIAARWSKLLDQRWNELVGLYRGTGARYVTVERLECWLSNL